MAELLPKEPWSWKRWFGGFIEGGRYGKDFAILLRLGILISIIALVAYGGANLWDRFFGKDEKPQAQPQVINSGGAPVDARKAQSRWSIFDMSDWFGGQKEEVSQ